MLKSSRFRPELRCKSMLYDYLELGYDPEAVEAFQLSRSKPFAGTGAAREPAKSKFGRRFMSFEPFKSSAARVSASAVGVGAKHFGAKGFEASPSSAQAPEHLRMGPGALRRSEDVPAMSLRPCNACKMDGF